MDTPGTAPADGGVFAGTIIATVDEGIFVQNAGTSTLFGDRRGFTASAISINTARPSTQIVINGMTFDTLGNPVQGLSTVTGVFINGRQAAGGGQFDPFSTVNGCVIGGSCQGSLVPPGSDIIGPIDPPSPSDMYFYADQILNIDVKKSDEDALLPLVDEPVTGVGNEDLWGDRCVPDQEPCERGN